MTTPETVALVAGAIATYTFIHIWRTHPSRRYRMQRLELARSLTNRRYRGRK